MIETAAPTINEGNEYLIVLLILMLKRKGWKMETEWNGTERRPVTIRSIPVQQQQKPKRVFVLPRERRPAHLICINRGTNVSVNEKRSIYKAVKRSPATATTKKTKGTKRKSEQQKQQ